MNPERPHFNREDLIRIIKLEYAIHHRVQLKDLYKLLFQAYYGPSHMSGNISQIKTGIITELKNMKPNKGTLIQDIGNGKGFVRIGLAMFAKDDNEARIDHLCESIEASKLSSGMDWDDWTDAWFGISNFLDSYIPRPTLREFLIEYVISKRIPNHSDAYKDANDPHYRLIRHEFCPWLQGSCPAL